MDNNGPECQIIKQNYYEANCKVDNLLSYQIKADPQRCIGNNLKPQRKGMIRSPGKFPALLEIHLQREEWNKYPAASTHFQIHSDIQPPCSHTHFPCHTNTHLQIPTWQKTQNTYSLIDQFKQKNKKGKKCKCSLDIVPLFLKNILNSVE